MAHGEATVFHRENGGGVIQTLAAMRHLRWLPFTFLCDMHGFAIFVPYAAVVLAVLPWVMRRPPQARPK